MFYSVENFPKGLFKASIIPRPIAWVSTLSPEGITNLAPFSYFQAISDDPPMIMFVVTSKGKDLPMKDTLINIEATKEFVINIAPESALELVHSSSERLEYNESEIEKFSIPIKKSNIVAPPYVAISPINLECVYVDTWDIKESIRGNKMVIGRVVGMSVDEAVMQDGRIMPERFHPLCRLGYHSYSAVDRVFSA